MASIASRLRNKSSKTATYDFKAPRAAQEYIEIAVNVQKAAPNKGDDSKTIAITHNGEVRYNGNTGGAFISFNPTPVTAGKLNKKGKIATFTPVFHVAEDGTRTELNRDQFWGHVVGTNDEGFVRASQISANLDMSASSFKKMKKAGEIKSIRFIVPCNELGTAFVFKGFSEYRKSKTRMVDLRFGSSVVVMESDKAVVADETYISNEIVEDAVVQGMLHSAKRGVTDVVEAFASASFCGVKITTSAKRREARKEKFAAPAVTAPAADANANPFAKYFTAPAPAPVAAAPAVDAEKEALRKENAELKTAIQSQGVQLAQLTALVQQLVTANAPTPVAPTAPQLEEIKEVTTTLVEEAPVASSPVIEVEEATTVAAEASMNEEEDGEEWTEVDSVEDLFGALEDAKEDTNEVDEDTEEEEVSSDPNGGLFDEFEGDDEDEDQDDNEGGMFSNWSASADDYDGEPVM